MGRRVWWAVPLGGWSFLVCLRARPPALSHGQLPPLAPQASRTSPCDHAGSSVGTVEHSTPPPAGRCSPLPAPNRPSDPRLASGPPDPNTPHFLNGTVGAPPRGAVWKPDDPPTHPLLHPLGRGREVVGGVGTRAKSPTKGSTTTIKCIHTVRRMCYHAPTRLSCVTTNAHWR